MVLSEFLKTNFGSEVSLLFSEHLVDIGVVVILGAVFFHELVEKPTALGHFLPLVAYLTFDVIDSLGWVDSEVERKVDGSCSLLRG